MPWATEVPTCFGRQSIAIFRNPPGFARFTAGAKVELREVDEVDWDVLTMMDGWGLAMREDHVDSVDRNPNEASLRQLLESTFLARFEGGSLRRVGHESVLSLLADPPAMELTIPTIAGSMLESETCVTASGATPFMQFPGSYAQALDLGMFAGILNRAPCHVGCGRDLVWIEHDMCLLWLRTRDAVANLEWIKFFPFRLDRSGPRGRLLML